MRKNKNLKSAKKCILNAKICKKKVGNKLTVFLYNNKTNFSTALL